MKFHLLILSFLLSLATAFAQTLPVYKNPQFSISERVNDLLGRMTPEEKFWQLFMIPGDIKKGDESKYTHGLFGFQVSAVSVDGNAAQQILKYGTGENALSLAKKINSIQKYFIEQTRLGIPMIAFDEALHGLVRNGATVFPQAIGLAATWDTSLMRQVALAIAQEAKTRGIRQILSPVINIASDARWGRTEETYGEDPFLTSAMGVAFVSAFEQNGIITTPKHFIANSGDGGRDSYPINTNEKLLYERDFVPFLAVIQKGGARSIMTAYNSVNGSPATANNWLLNHTLKDKWGFKGFVISDASAVGGANVLHFTSPDYATSGKQSIINGLDVIFQTAQEHHRLFIQPFLDGTIPKEKIDAAVSRVLRAKFELGLFEQPYVSEDNTIDSSELTKHKTLARQAATASLVLLKNENNILPIQQNIRSIAMIGPDAVEARLGGYSGPGNGKRSILEGIKTRAGKGVQVMYAEGSKRINDEVTVIPAAHFSSVVDGKKQPGLLGEYFNNISLEGKATVTRIDKDIDFSWTLFPPDNLLKADFYSARWTGEFTAPAAGKIPIGLKGNDGFRLYIDHKLVIDNWDKQSFHTLLTDFVFEKNKQYPIRIEFKEPNGNAHLQMVWRLPNQQQQKLQQAVTTAQKSDLIVFVAGIEEGEFRDRSSLSLPGNQEALLQKLLATGKPVVVLLVGGSAVTMQNWLTKTKAVLDCWYPGEQGGDAVAAVLFGDANPAGRLPISFPIAEGQLPLVYNHQPTGRGDDYNDLSGLPLFPFGYGLSYTQFEYSNLHIDKTQLHKNDSAIVSFQLKNVGKRAGDEVVQLYIRDELASVARPVMELKGFQRVHLNQEEEKEIHFLITKELLEMYNERMEKLVEPGDFRIMIGASSRDIRLKETLSVLDDK